MFGFSAHGAGCVSPHIGDETQHAIMAQLIEGKLLLDRAQPGNPDMLSLTVLKRLAATFVCLGIVSAPLFVA